MSTKGDREQLAAELKRGEASSQKDQLFAAYIKKAVEANPNIQLEELLKNWGRALSVDDWRNLGAILLDPSILALSLPNQPPVHQQLLEQYYHQLRTDQQRIDFSHQLNDAKLYLLAFKNFQRLWQSPRLSIAFLQRVCTSACRSLVGLEKQQPRENNQLWNELMMVYRKNPRLLNNLESSGTIISVAAMPKHICREMLFILRQYDRIVAIPFSTSIPIVGAENQQSCKFYLHALFRLGRYKEVTTIVGQLSSEDPSKNKWLYPYNTLALEGVKPNQVAQLGHKVDFWSKEVEEVKQEKAGKQEAPKLKVCHSELNEELPSEYQL